MNAPQLRPLGVGEILDVSLKLTWRNVGTLARIVLFVVAPAQVLASLILVSAIPDWARGVGGVGGPFGGFGTSSDQPETISGSDVRTLVVGYALVLLISLLSSQLATGACFRAIASAYLGERTGWRDSLRFALKRLHSILWIVVAGAVVEGIGFLLCIVPGVYLAVAFAVALPALMTEDCRGWNALTRSRRLVSGSWWRTAGILFVAGLLASIVGGALSGAISAVSFVDRHDEVLLFVVTAISGTVAALFTTPFKAAYTTILYFDLRVRKEAFDLQLLAQQIGVEPPEGWTPPAPAAGPPPPDELGEGEQPPYWPPPPGWKPRSES